MRTTSDDLDSTTVEADDGSSAGISDDVTTPVELDKPTRAAKVVDNAPGGTEESATEKAAGDQKRPLTKAEKLEARAARLREAELAREQRRREAAALGTGAGSRNSLPWIIATGALAFLLTLALALGIPYALDKRDAVAHNAALNTARAEALTTAKKAATAFATYNYAHVDQDLNATLSYLTPKFRTAYSPVVAQLKPYIAKGHGVATASIRCTGVSQLSTTRAVIIVCLDQSVTTSASKTATINRNRAVVTLVKQHNGRWLVDDFILR